MSTITIDEIEPVASAAALNLARCRELLRRFAPKAIANERENRRAIAAATYLAEKDRRSAEEQAVLDLLASLIDQFERRVYPVRPVPPREMLEHLMNENGLIPADLAKLMGGRSRVSDVLSSKREISKEQARRLADRFRVSPALFI